MRGLGLGRTRVPEDSASHIVARILLSMGVHCTFDHGPAGLDGALIGGDIELCSPHRAVDRARRVGEADSGLGETIGGEDDRTEIREVPHTDFGVLLQELWSRFLISEERGEFPGRVAPAEVDCAPWFDCEDMAVADGDMQEEVFAGSHQGHDESGWGGRELVAPRDLKDRVVAREQGIHRLLSPIRLVFGRRVCRRPGLRVALEDLLDRGLRAEFTVVSIRCHRHEAAVTEGERDTIFVGIGMGVGLPCAPPRKRNGRRPEAVEFEMAELLVLSAA